jgi:hypothetical protein
MLTVQQNDPDGPEAVAARKWFAENGPPDLQPLPLGYNERERLKHGGADHILAWYARSLDCRNYDVRKHPSFEDYARGVMASEFCSSFIKTEDTTGELQKRFPARYLYGLGPGLIWEPPGQHEQTMASSRRNRALSSRKIDASAIRVQMG